MESGSEIEGLAIGVVGVCLIIASIVSGRLKRPPVAIACLMSGSVLCTASQVVMRLELWTGSLTAFSNQTFLFALAIAIMAWIWQAWAYSKALSKLPEAPPKP